MLSFINLQELLPTSREERRVWKRGGEREVKVVVSEKKRRRNRRKWEKEEHEEGVMEGRKQKDDRCN